MKKSAIMGKNRTGRSASPKEGKEQEKSRSWSPVPPEPGVPGESLGRVRAIYDAEPETVGTVPPPPSLKGMAKSALQAGMGRNPAAFIDKLGERLAFERTGTRLFDLLLAKLESEAGSAVPADASTLRLFREQEAAHFRLLWECLEALGADPTVQTPSADLAGVKSGGILQLLSDPRTTFSQGLDGMLIAELTDNEGWRLLITLAEGMGQDRMAGDFRKALEEEDVHLERIRDWWAQLNLVEADLEGTPVETPLSPP